jgi:hypothetical protein
MATNDTGDWRDLFDVALFEPNRVKLRKRIERARNAINERLHFLMGQQGESGRDMSERIALNDALTTLTELHRIVYTRKPNTQVGGEGGRAAS